MPRAYEKPRTVPSRDHVLRVALRVGRVDLDVVAGTGRDVLDIQSSHHRTAPLVIRVAADLRQRSRRAAGTENVVGSINLMRRGRKPATDPKPGRYGCCR